MNNGTYNNLNNLRIKKNINDHYNKCTSYPFMEQI